MIIGIVADAGCFIGMIIAGTVSDKEFDRVKFRDNG
jgi:hypothetical protein